MMTRWMIVGLGCVALASGCGGRSTWDDRSERWTSYDDAPVHVMHEWPERPEPRPELPSDGSIDEALGAAEASRREGALAVGAALAAARVERWSVDQATRAVTSCYRLGARDEARAVVAAHPGLVTWDEVGGAVTCVFVASSSGGGELELTITRPEADRAVAVVFEPGTFGVASEVAGRDDEWVSPESQRRFGEWPTPQDLALLRAPVVALAVGQRVAAVRVPVACASFQRPSPTAGQAYALRSFEAGSAIDRLMVELCAGDQLPAGEAEAQVAVWIARDDVDWASFVANGGGSGRLGTFGRNEPIRARHALGAAAVLTRSGVDPRDRRFFEGARPAPERQATTPAAPRDAPAPQADPVPVPEDAGKVS